MKFLTAIILLLGSVNAFAIEQGDCQDFSGFWAGQCTDNLGTFDKSFFAIEQAKDCRSLSWGPHPINFGAENTTTWNGGNTTRVDNVDWETPLQKNLVGTTQLTSVNSPDILGQVRFDSPQPKQLNIDIVGTIDFGDGQLRPFHQVCSYKRVKKIRGDE